jgi:hypothetical protein
VELPGYRGWSNKAGVWQVQPPAEVLANMVAVRVHLDDCQASNGPLRIIPGSHRCGWIEDLDAWKSRVPEVICTVSIGGVVTMCPLTLHASARSDQIANRRVIHIEYAAAELPSGLDWNVRIGDCGRTSRSVQIHRSRRLADCDKARYNYPVMTTAVQEILAQIDRLDAAGQEELRAALRLRSRSQWERLAEVERARSATEGITEADIDRAVNDVRYGTKAS